MMPLPRRAQLPPNSGPFTFHAPPASMTVPHAQPLMTATEWARLATLESERRIPHISSRRSSSTTKSRPSVSAGGSSFLECRPLDPSHHSSGCRRRTEGDIEMGDSSSRAPGSSTAATGSGDVSTSSSRKRKAPDSHGEQSPQKKKQKTVETTKQTAGPPVDGHEQSTSQQVPLIQEPLLFHPGSSSAPPAATQQMTKRTFVCPIPGCFQRKPRFFGRVQERHRHICTAIRHEVERSVPGWEKRWGIPDDYNGKIKYCPYISCPQRRRAMRRNEHLNKHMRRDHRIDMTEWNWRVGCIAERMKEEGRWTEEDDRRKEWIYEREVDEFVGNPGEESFSRWR